MYSPLATLRQRTPPLRPAAFVRLQPGCLIQYFDDTPARDPAKALSAPAFDPDTARRKQREGCAVCFSLQAFAGARTKDRLLSYRNFGVDVDLVAGPDRRSVPAAEVDRRKDAYLTSCLRPFPLRPHWLVETRHGFHAVFRVLPVRDPVAVRQAEVLTRRLVRILRGDPHATLLTQVLRVPGTWQFKDPADPFLCRLLLNWAGVLPPYPLDTVRGVLDAWEVFHPGGGDTPAGVTSGVRPRRPWREGLRGVPEGQRNATAASVAGAIVYRLPDGLWEVAGWGGLKEWNARNAVPLSERELRAVFESIARREWSSRQAGRGTHTPPTPG